LGLLLPSPLLPMRRPPAPPTLFPYTTLFRSARLGDPVARQRNPHPCQVRVPNPHHRAGTVQPVLDPVLLQLRRDLADHRERHPRDRKSTRLNSSHVKISYAVFCLKKKKGTTN